jgi:hypothetical protein
MVMHQILTSMKVFYLPLLEDDRRFHVRCSGSRCATGVLVKVVPELNSITQSSHVSFPQEK